MNINPDLDLFLNIEKNQNAVAKPAAPFSKQDPQIRYNYNIITPYNIDELARGAVRGTYNARTDTIMVNRYRLDYGFNPNPHKYDNIYRLCGLSGDTIEENSIIAHEHQHRKNHRAANLNLCMGNVYEYALLAGWDEVSAHIAGMLQCVQDTCAIPPEQKDNAYEIAVLAGLREFVEIKNQYVKQNLQSAVKWLNERFRFGLPVRPEFFELPRYASDRYNRIFRQYMTVDNNFYKPVNKDDFKEIADHFDDIRNTYLRATSQLVNMLPR